MKLKIASGEELNGKDYYFEAKGGRVLQYCGAVNDRSCFSTPFRDGSLWVLVVFLRDAEVRELRRATEMEVIAWAADAPTSSSTES